MADLYGRRYSRADLMQRVGRLEQIAGIESSVSTDGAAAGARLLRVSTGSGLTFSVTPDRCLDLPHLAFNGRSLTWYGSPGMVAPQLYGSDEQGFLRAFFGGLLTTCGLRNSGPSCTVDGEWFPVHGRISSLPAEEVAWGQIWDGDDCTFWIEGTVRESRVFGENLVMRRRITTQLGATGLHISTVVRNEGWRPEGHMILFHMNVGFPLLDDDARLLVEPSSVQPRDDEAREGLAVYDRFVGPQPEFHEQVFILDLKPDEAGLTEATIVNESLDGGLGLRLRWPKEQLPWMIEWRQVGQGVYVVGLEPSNCPTIEGRAVAIERGALPLLAPGEERRYEITVDILVGRAAWQHG